MTKKTSPRKKEAAPTQPVIGNKEFQRSEFYEFLSELMFISFFRMPPGEPIAPLSIVVNLNKGTMCIYLFALMCYFDNFSKGAWVYLALHGNYGMMWWMKDTIFPDALGFG